MLAALHGVLLLPGAEEASEEVLTAKKLLGQPTVCILVQHPDTVILQGPSHSQGMDYNLPLIPAVMRQKGNV